MAFPTSETTLLAGSPFQRRTRWLAALFGLGFLVLLGRLVQLQVLHAREYRHRGERRLHKLVPIPPTRGRILDRGGAVLAEDRPAFDLWLLPARYVRRGGRREVASHLGELEAARLVQIARSRGETRRLETALALRYLTEADPLARHLADVLGRPRDEVARRILAAAVGRQADSEEELTQPRPCFPGVGEAAYLAVARARLDRFAPFRFHAVEPRIGARRVYPGGSDTGHLTGYVGRLTAEEYDRLRGYWKRGVFHEGTWRLGDFFVLDHDADPERSVERSIIRWRPVRRAGRVVHVAGYFTNETVGRAGVERAYNQWLRGHHAQRLLRLARPDPKGPRRFVQVEANAHPAHGHDLALGLSLEMQRGVRAILRDELRKLRLDRQERFQGVCILMDPETGRIHAMVSEPAYDPNAFRRDFPDLLEDPLKPLINHAIAGQYPPGSVFKPVVALAGLQERAIERTTRFDCSGSIRLGDREYIEFRRLHHGELDVIHALEVSSNIFMYRTGEKLGGPRLYAYAAALGFGRPTGIDLAGETPGHLPERARTGRGWALGNTYHFSIGQGPITVTPLQIAVAYAAIANGGKVVRPHLRYAPDDPALEAPVRTVRLDPAVLETVREGMRRVVQGSSGTARNARIPGLEIAGKTGSAEWKKGETTHAWFAGFAPYERPRVVFVILVPEGDFGGSTCGPIARRILMYFFGIDEAGGEEGALG